MLTGEYAGWSVVQIRQDTYILIPFTEWSSAMVRELFFTQLLLAALLEG